MKHAITRDVAVLAAVLFTTACGGGARSPRSPAEERIVIAFLMDTVQQERWQRDRELFVARAKERGAEVIVEAAEGDAARQLAQAQSVLDKGVKVLEIGRAHV